MNASARRAFLTIQALEEGTTLVKLAAALECSRRTAIRWIAMADEFRPVERMPGDTTHEHWAYRFR
jgi:predicted DNA-binding transcriptional regulator YafY